MSAIYALLIFLAVVVSPRALYALTNLNQCAVLNKPNETYALQNDVTSAGTCFSVQADNITLDLNGHTVTYGNEGGVSIPNGGFENGTALWDLSGAPGSTVNADPLYVAEGQHRLVIPKGDSPKTITHTGTFSLSANVPYALFVALRLGRDNQITFQLVDAETDTPLASDTITAGSSSMFYPTTMDYTPTKNQLVRVRFFVNNQANPMYLDDVQIQRQRSYGVVASGCTTSTLGPNPCGGTAANFTLTNGTIQQGLGNGIYSHAIYNYGRNANGWKISHIIGKAHGPSSHIVLFRFRSDYEIHDNQFLSDVRLIHSRHQIHGAIMNMLDGSNGRIYNNVLRGGAQGGIRVGSADTKVYGNDISQNGRYTNDFSIYGYGKNAEIFSNNIHPESGRGIHVDAENVTVYDNTIVAKEKSQNQEYNGCVDNGAYGIQIEEKTAINSNIFNNDVTVESGECGGIAFRLKDTPNPHRIFNNTFRALGHGGKHPMVAIGPQERFWIGHDKVVIENNTFISDEYILGIDWNPSYNFVARNNIFRKGPNPTEPFRFANVIPAFESLGNRFIDSTFMDGIDPNSGRYQGYEAAPFEVLYQWTLTALAKDMSNAPVPEVKIIIRNEAGDLVFSGLTNELGEIRVPLTQHRKSNVASDPLFLGANYLVAAQKGNVVTPAQRVTMDQKRTLAFIGAFPLGGYVGDNQPPEVSTGADQVVITTQNPVNLMGVVSDDGNPSPTNLNIRWSRLAGYGEIKFADANQAQTTAFFPKEGTYVLRLTADDNEDIVYDEVQIFIASAPNVAAPPVEPDPTNTPPFVSAGNDFSLVLGDSAELDGQAGDDGLPSNPGRLTYLWRKLSGPGEVTFVDPRNPATLVGFSASGIYSLQLTCSDGQSSVSDVLRVTVHPSALPPPPPGGGVSDGEESQDAYPPNDPPIQLPKFVNSLTPEQPIVRIPCNHSVRILNRRGQLVFESACHSHQVEWSGKGSSGDSVPSGIYLIHEDGVDLRKVAVIH